MGVKDLSAFAYKKSGMRERYSLGKAWPSLGILGLCLSPVPAIPGLGLCGVQPSPPLPVTWSPLSLACPPAQPGLLVGVPGMVKGLHEAHQLYGR